MKELPYFRFTVQEWQNDDISFCDFKTKGVFIDVCCAYWAKDCSINVAMLKQKFSDAITEIETLIKIGILKVDKKDNISINFLNKQFDILSEKRKKLQIAGSLGGQKKVANAKANAKQKLKQNCSYKDKDKDKNITPTTGVVYNNYYDKELLTLNAKKTDVSVCAPEISTYSAKYEAFIKYLFGNNELGQKIDHVLKLEQQLSFDQFVKLSQKAGEAGKLKMKFDSLINNPKYSKGKKSIYLIINNWLNLDDKR